MPELGTEKFKTYTKQIETVHEEAQRLFGSQYPEENSPPESHRRIKSGQFILM